MKTRTLFTFLLTLILSTFISSEAWSFIKTDDFNRSGPAPGKNWVTDNGYSIENNELSFTGSGWNHLAIFKTVKNAKSVSFRWGSSTNAAGRRTGGICIMLSDASLNADGYFILKKSEHIYLMKITNGEIDGGAIDETTANSPSTKADDIIKVIPQLTGTSNRFQVFINGIYDGTVEDKSKTWTHAQWYSGIMLYGGDDHKNNIDDVIVELPNNLPSTLKKYNDPFQGTNQHAVFGQTYPDSLAVMAVDAFDNPIPNIFIDFEPE